MRIMKNISDRHHEALAFIAKAQEDLALTAMFLLDGKAAQAFGKISRAENSIRMILHEQADLTPEDKDE
ncbi:MAG: hypothetical protein IIC67_07360 [Thaumarchaeota archaeon]|nr:hypothetical protein [Nitrososphaerota archaeon]